MGDFYNTGLLIYKAPQLLFCFLHPCFSLHPAVGLDYSSPSEVIIPVSSGPSVFCFNVTIIDDSIAHERDEELLVSFQAPAGSAVQVGSFSSISILILDNDGE